MLRLLSVVFVGMALALVVGQPALAAETHEGKIVDAANGKLTMTDKDGKNKHTHDVPATARITCDGKACKLEDLKSGFAVKVTVDKNVDGKQVVTQIAATTK